MDKGICKDCGVYHDHENPERTRRLREIAKHERPDTECEHCFGSFCESCQRIKLIEAIAMIRNETIIWEKVKADDTIRKLHRIAVDVLKIVS